MARQVKFQPEPKNSTPRFRRRDPWLEGEARRWHWPEEAFFATAGLHGLHGLQSCRSDAILVLASPSVQPRAPRSNFRRCRWLRPPAVVVRDWRPFCVQSLPGLCLMLITLRFLFLWRAVLAMRAIVHKLGAPAGRYHCTRAIHRSYYQSTPIRISRLPFKASPSSKVRPSWSGPKAVYRPPVRFASSTQKARDLNQQGIDEQESELDKAQSQERDKQTRTPWHREGADEPPVRRQRSAGAMAKGWI